MVPKIFGLVTPMTYNEYVSATKKNAEEINHNNLLCYVVTNIPTVNGNDNQCEGWYCFSCARLISLRMRLRRY